MSNELRLKPRKRSETDAVVWYIIGTYLGVPVKKSLGTDDYKIAKERYAKVLPGLMAKIRDGHLVSGSFGQLAAQYIAKGNSDRYLAPIIAKFGKRPVNDISDDELCEWAATYGDAAAKPWSMQTRNRQIITPFMAVCNWGARQKPPKCAPRLIERFSFERTKVRAAPDEWIRQVLDACEKEAIVELTETRKLNARRRAQNALALRALVIFNSLTSPRISEAIRIEWADVHLDQRFVVLTKVKTKRHKLKQRRVELPQIAVDCLTAIKPIASDKIVALNARVFPWKHHGAVAKRLRALCRRNDLPYYSSHKWGRHAFAERLLRLGYSLLHVKEQGGWASLSVLEENYGHLEQRGLHAAVNAGADALIAGPEQKRLGNG
jgi:integrase